MKKKLFYRFLSILQRASKEKEPKNLKKILLCNCAALGDVFLMSLVIPSIKEAIPGVRIGVLVAPDSKVVVENHPDITWIHELNYWLKPGLKKVKAYLQFHLVDKWKVAKQLRGYDAALNFCPVYCDVQGIFSIAKIPHRIGFDFLGYQKLLTKKIEWNSETYILNNFQSLINSIGANGQGIQQTSLRILKRGYVIFHIGSALRKKDLPLSFWKGLYEKQVKAGKKVYFTGKGQKEAISQITSCVEENLSDRLSWKEFISVIEHADRLYSVDTVAVHVAAAFDTPHVAFYQATPDLDLWRPNVPNGLAFVKRDQALMHHRDDRLFLVDEFNPSEIEI